MVHVRAASLPGGATVPAIALSGYATQLDRAWRLASTRIREADQLRTARRGLASSSPRGGVVDVIGRLMFT
jgi:hypothetical protein